MKATCYTLVLASILFGTQSKALADGNDFDLSTLANAAPPMVEYKQFQPIARPVRYVAPRNAQLPPVSTSSVDFNVCDMPFTRDRGSSGIPMPDYNPNANGNQNGGGGGGGTGGTTGGGGLGAGSGGSGNGGGTGGGLNTGGTGAGYVSGAPAYRYMSNGAYMTGSGIIVYPNGHRERGGPMFRYRSGYGFTDLNRPGMGYTWDRSAIYSYYQ